MALENLIELFSAADIDLNHQEGITKRRQLCPRCATLDVGVMTDRRPIGITAHNAVSHLSLAAARVLETATLFVDKVAWY